MIDVRSAISPGDRRRGHRRLGKPRAQTRHDHRDPRREVLDAAPEDAVRAWNTLAELAQAELKSPLQQRKLENLVDRIGQQVAEQLVPVLEQRFGDLPDNEAEVAVRYEGEAPTKGDGFVDGTRPPRSAVRDQSVRI